MRNFWIGLLLIMACSRSPQQEINPTQHAQEIADWHEKRVNSLLAEEGWLNLIGLFWLQEGSNSFGSGEEETLKIESPLVPASLGIFDLTGNQVFFTPTIQGVSVEGEELTGSTLIFDADKGESVKLAYGSLRWNIIKRADAFGVRLRDLEASAVTTFDHIPQYPISVEWRLSGRFIPYDPPRELMITNVLGQTTPNPSPGYVVFEKDGKEYQLQALEEGDQLFLILADGTSGGETYGGGRYLYVPKPVGDEPLVIDFNKAYNPPCVFTPFATCPLPPRENVLELNIMAGEKTFGEH
jgi:uncharacterized protein